MPLTNKVLGLGGMKKAQSGLKGVQRARVTRPVHNSPVLAQKPRVANPVMPQESNMSRAIRLKHASQTSQQARLTKMKASDPVGMLKFDRDTQYKNPTSLGLRDAKYQRSLYR